MKTRVSVLSKLNSAPAYMKKQLPTFKEWGSNSLPQLFKLTKTLRSSSYFQTKTNTDVVSLGRGRSPAAQSFLK